MRIANIMFSRNGGGIEQASIDYAEGLRDIGHQVVTFIVPDAWAIAPLQKLGLETHSIGNFGEWDFIAAHRLRKKLLQLKIDIVIAHSNRAFGLAKKAIKDRIPLVGVAHNYSTSRLHAADGVFTITRDLINHITQQGVPAEKIFHVPNMVSCGELPHRGAPSTPPVIGTLGRFVAKKGFDVYIDALKALKTRGVDFKAVIGGTGAEATALKTRAAAAGLASQLTFLGWVQDKKAFYSGLDIFCLPSLHEPFGIVLLEAFTFGTPVVATDSEGPRDIITPNYDALIVPMGNAEAMADAIESLIKDHKLADKLATNAFVKTKTQYSTEVVAHKIEAGLNATIANWKY